MTLWRCLFPAHDVPLEMPVAETCRRLRALRDEADERDLSRVRLAELEALYRRE